MTVCTANICRSPVAHLLLQGRLGDRVTVTSAGTRALTGSPMDPRSAIALRERIPAGQAIDGSAGQAIDGSAGQAIDGFRATPLTSARIEAADLILTATRSHRDAALRLAPRAMKRTFTLLEFAELAARLPDTADDLIAGAARQRAQLTGELDIDDPVGIDDTGYRHVMSIIDRVTDQIAARLQPLVNGPA